MIVYLDKIKYKVFWAHKKFDTPTEITRHDNSRAKCTGTTTCYLKNLETKEITNHSFAMCMNEDIFDPNIGRLESLHNLLCVLPKGHSKIIWHKFTKEVSRTVKIKVPSHLVKQFRSEFNIWINMNIAEYPVF